MMKNKKLFRNADQNTVTLFVISLLIFIVIGAKEPSFLRKANLQGMLIQIPEYGILSFGMMLAMISGGIDLSLVGIANFSSIVAAVIMTEMNGTPASIVLGILAALMVGMGCGLFNGFMIGYLQIPAMLVTLSGLQIYTGLGLIITKGPAITKLPEAFSNIANGTFIGIPNGAILFVIVIIALNYIMNSTIFGRKMFLMGSNSVAAKFSGINTLKTSMTTYAISGILGSIAGLLMASHYNSAKSDYGSSYTLQTLLIAVLGGTNPDGGRGKLSGVVMAILLLQLISSAFNILRINAFVKTFVFGLVLVLVMVGSKLVERRKKSEF